MLTTLSLDERYYLYKWYHLTYSKEVWRIRLYEQFHNNKKSPTNVGLFYKVKIKKTVLSDTMSVMHRIVKLSSISFILFSSLLFFEMRVSINLLQFFICSSTDISSFIGDWDVATAFGWFVIFFINQIKHFFLLWPTVPTLYLPIPITC